MDMLIEQNRYEKLLALAILSDLYNSHIINNPELAHKVLDAAKGYSNNVNQEYLKQGRENFLVKTINEQETALENIYVKTLDKIAKNLHLNLINKIDGNYLPKENDLIYINYSFSKDVSKEEQTKFTDLLKEVQQYKHKTAGIVLDIKKLENISNEDVYQLLDLQEHGKFANGPIREDIGKITLLLSSSHIENIPKPLLAKVLPIDVKFGVINIPNIEIMRSGSMKLASKIPKNQLH